MDNRTQPCSLTFCYFVLPVTRARVNIAQRRSIMKKIEIARESESMLLLTTIDFEIYFIRLSVMAVLIMIVLPR